MKAITKPRPKIKFRLFLSIILLLILLNLPFVSAKIKNLFYSVSLPLQKNFWSSGSDTAVFFKTIVNYKKLAEENRNLELKIKELLLLNYEVFDLRKENKILRKALDLGLETEFQLISAEVTGRYINSDAIFINKGSKSGVVKGSPAVTEEKMLVGKVNEVYDNFSKVLLLSDRSMVFNVEVVKAEGSFDEIVPGIINGAGNFQLELKLIPKEKEIEEGDSTITSVLGGIFPKGLYVGSVKEVKGVDIEPFWQIKIQPGVDINNLNKVFLLTNPQ
ncbi:MAG: rod shape-determining protein MreC [Candidatus Wildermuthbacteria bacterium RIFCSPHIGHO2_12_FULL_40_12]|uniref:Cell shape-determining protein MreC n=1 Tax=Candidatus Wildermuthbacteria bacterium RIFCSPHIGHO2_12_FULL_40_12 TaxID=1802457 RepID=A0A1G2RCW1_9BACT|nr:MAG: rod shape-determining protein MreC [Candidatus Wildermuthbacteria bacterium RIFCSPHIGHO2_12_FULL_40_12]